MNDFKCFVKRIACGTILLSAVLINPSVLRSADGPTSVEDLDPETRASYEELYAQWQEARVAIEEAEQRSYDEDPFLKAAVEGERQARELETEAGRLYSQVKEHYDNKGKDGLKAFKRWKGCYGEVLDYERANKALDNPAQRWIYQWYVSKVVKEMNSSGHAPGWNLVEDLLPPDLSELSPERALEIFVELLRRNKDKNLAKLPELEKAADPPEFARTYVEKMGDASALLMFYDGYIRSNKPNYIKEARHRTQDIAARMTQLWPNWAQADEAAFWKARDESRKRGDSLIQISKRWTIIVVNLVVVVALVLLIVSRRRRLRREA